MTPGRYLFQFVDRRPQYDYEKRPQKQTTVTVRSNRSVFTWDARKQWAGRSTYVRAVKASKPRKVWIKLATRAGGLSVDLYPMAAFGRSRVQVTATNRKTGQWYVARATNGMVSFAGLMPGSYKISAPGAGDYLPRSGNLPGSVRPGRVTFSSFSLTQRGGWVGGSVTSQSGLRMVLRPAYDWIACPDPDRGSVKYRPRAITVTRVVSGKGTALGQIRLSRHNDAAKKICKAPTPGA